VLNIFKSNRVENLMDALVSVLGQVSEDPMQPEWIGIQSKGMKQWISLKMTEQFGVCANTKFVFPRQMVEYILSGHQPLTTVENSAHSLDEMNQDILFWSILKQLNGKENHKIHDHKISADKRLNDLFAYIHSDKTGKKRFQLALKIASLFDDYQVYRPNMLLDWQAGKKYSEAVGQHTGWQAQLWKTVSGDQADHLPGKIQMFLDQFSLDTILENHYPHQMSLFGISTLPNQFLHVFKKISDIIDVNLFFLVPSNQYFFDLHSQADLDRMALKTESDFDQEQLHYETANPLLSSLGSSIQSFCSILETIEYQEPDLDLFVDPVEENSHMDENNRMLDWIQSDILNLIHRSSDIENPKIQVSKVDQSIQIHACHSPMRETQVLKDIVLNAFENDPELAPHDIIVMMPDIESYAPFIESVFSFENSLPFTISDRRKRSESDVIKAFLKIVSLKNTRFERAQVLDLLLSDAIAQKFNITSDDISKIEQMVADANILWGKSGHHRESLDLPGFEENTWEFGLDRLFLGMAMPENYNDLVSGVLPCESLEGLEMEILGKFAQFCHTLFARLDALTHERIIQHWCKEFKGLISQLLDRNNQTLEDMSFLFQTLDQMEDDAQLAGFTEKVSFEIILSLIEQKLDQSIAQGNFMAGKITFCNIMPMRSIPFKVVALMGMDEQAFPRKAYSPGFDLIKKFPIQGDKNQRDEDRYLFLESLLSARDKFIVTFTGMNIQDNSPIPCSGVVSELLETIEQSFELPEQSNIFYSHPLHPFDEKYFKTFKGQDSAFLKSYSTDNLNIALALSASQKEPAVFLNDTDVKTVLTVPDNLESYDFQLADMIQFFRHPLKMWIQKGLNVELPDISDPDSDRENFSITGLGQYLLGSNLMESFSDLNNGKDLYSFFRATGVLPYGDKGRIEYDRILQDALPVIEHAKDLIHSPPLPQFSCSRKIGDLTVSGHISDIRENGQCILTYGKINGARLISAWVNHLFFNLAAPEEYPKSTIIVGRDPFNKKPVARYGFKPMGEKAISFFEDLVALFCKGSKQPVFLFSETAWQFVQAFVKVNFEATNENIAKMMAQSKIKTSWQGNQFVMGEKQDRYTALCVQNNDPFASVQSLIDSGFVQNSCLVYQPMLENLQDLS